MDSSVKKKLLQISVLLKKLMHHTGVLQVTVGDYKYSGKRGLKDNNKDFWTVMICAGVSSSSKLLNVRKGKGS